MLRRSKTCQAIGQNTLFSIFAVIALIAFSTSCLAQPIDPSAFDVNGKKYLRYVVPAAHGERSIILVGPNFSEIKTESQGQGRIDLWEVKTKDFSFRASEPVQGHFKNISMERRRPEDRLLISMILSNDGKTYQATSARSVPYKVLHADASDGLEIDEKTTTRDKEDATPSPTSCRQKNISDLSAVLKALTGSKELKQKDLSCKITRLAPLFFSQDCNQDRWRKSQPAMSEALSHLLVDAAESSPTVGAFVCVETNRPELAEKMRAILFKRLYDTSLESKGAISNLTSHSAVTCSSVKTVTAPTKEPLVKCDPEDTKHRGELDQKTFPEVLGIKKPNVSANDYFGTIFHELIHAAGEEDEQLTRDLECDCGSSSPTECKKNSTKAQHVMLDTPKIHEMAGGKNNRISNSPATQANSGTIATDPPLQFGVASPNRPDVARDVHQADGAVIALRNVASSIGSFVSTATSSAFSSTAEASVDSASPGKFDSISTDLSSTIYASTLSAKPSLAERSNADNGNQLETSAGALNSNQTSFKAAKSGEVAVRISTARALASVSGVGSDGSGGASALSSLGSSQKTSIFSTRASFEKFLVGDYTLVRKEISSSNPAFQKALKTFSTQLTDEQGIRHGPALAQIKYIFCAKQSRLTTLQGCQ